MSRPRKAPHSARVLTQWVDAYARQRGLGQKRVRDWVSYMVVGGQLERASSAAEGPRFTIKGAVALEMRLPTKARATEFDLHRRTATLRLESDDVFDEVDFSS